MNEYPNGNEVVLKMIMDGDFDECLARALLKGVDLNAPICDLNGYTTSYLYEAVEENNLKAVSFFLENGANPNMINQDYLSSCALWDLQYIDNNHDWKTRYEIAKLFFQYGANPNLIRERESLYDYVVYKVYNDIPENDNDWENLIHFYKLLIIYGGGNDKSHYGKPILYNIDQNKVDEYDVVLSRHGDNYHIVGKLIDRNGNVVGEL